VINAALRRAQQARRFGCGGFVRIALRTGAPIIPCAVVGAEEIHPIVARADWDELAILDELGMTTSDAKPPPPPGVVRVPVDDEGREISATR